MEINELIKTLPQYSSLANGGVDLISSALRPVAFIMLGIFFLIELNDWKKVLEMRGQSMTRKLWIELSVKYLFAVILIMISSTLLDAIMEIGAIILQTVNKVIPLESYTYKFEIGEINDFFINIIVGFFGGVIEAVAKFIVGILLFMRFVDLYLLKAVAPIFIAFFMSDSLRSITINFVKSYVAYALIGVILLIVSIIYGLVIKEDLLQTLSGAESPLQVAIASLARGIIYIFIIVGVGRKTRQLMGVA